MDFLCNRIYRKHPLPSRVPPFPRPARPPKCRSYLGVGGTSTHGEVKAPVFEADPVHVLEALGERATRDDHARRIAEVGDDRRVAH